VGEPGANVMATKKPKADTAKRTPAESEAAAAAWLKAIRGPRATEVRFADSELGSTAGLLAKTKAARVPRPARKVAKGSAA
jgi:hypothetical protein